jgi:hypothetical protein
MIRGKNRLLDITLALCIRRCLHNVLILGFLISCACIIEPRRSIPLMFTGEGTPLNGKSFSTIEFTEGDNKLEISGYGDPCITSSEDRIYIYIKVSEINNKSTPIVFTTDNIIIESNYFQIQKKRAYTGSVNCCDVELVHNYSSADSQTPDDLMRNYRESYLRLIIKDVFLKPYVVNIKYDEKGYKWASQLRRG